MAAGLVFMLLLLSIPGHSSATWCICKGGMSDTVLQKTLDYACGAGADCGPTHQNGPCFNPNTVRAHCNYAVNSYFQRKRQLPTACDFAGTATIVTSDPSTAGCMYPASASVSTTSPVIGASGTPVTTVPNGGSTTGSPFVTTPNTGVLGGITTGLGPSGINNNDFSAGGVILPRTITSFSSIIFTVSALVLSC